MGVDTLPRITGYPMECPAEHAFSITPNSTEFNNYTRSIYIGGDGSITLDTVGGETGVVFAGLTAGSILPVRAKKVTAATATNLVGLY